MFKLRSCHFAIIARDIKSIFRENFSPSGFNSGKIFKIITFTRGPRATYCMANFQVLKCRVLDSSPLKAEFGMEKESLISLNVI